MKPEVLKEMVRDWANIKRRQACDILGSPEAGELLADAKKFDLVVDFLTELGHTAQPAVAPTPAVKQGWKLVPVEPTSEMLSAVGKEMSWCNPVGIFRKMLAATPAAPSRPAVPQGEPVAWMVTNGGNQHSLYFNRMYADEAVWSAKNLCCKKSIPNDFQIHPLYAVPSQTDDAPDPVLSALIGVPVSRKVWGEFKAWQSNKEAALREKEKAK